MGSDVAGIGVKRRSRRCFWKSMRTGEFGIIAPIRCTLFFIFKNSIFQALARLALSWLDSNAARLRASGVEGKMIFQLEIIVRKILIGIGTTNRGLFTEARVFFPRKCNIESVNSRHLGILAATTNNARITAKTRLFRDIRRQSSLKCWKKLSPVPFVLVKCRNWAWSKGIGALRW